MSSRDLPVLERISALVQENDRAIDFFKLLEDITGQPSTSCKEVRLNSSVLVEP